MKMHGLAAAAAWMVAALTNPTAALAQTKVNVGYTAAGDVTPVFLAKEKGFFEKRGLDVTLTRVALASTIPAALMSNSLQIGTGTGAGLLQAVDGGLDLVTVSGASRQLKSNSTMSLLARKEAKIAAPADLKGKKIGVKGAITPSVKAMLAKAGLVEGTDYQTVLLDGFDPKVHIEVPDIVGFPGYKSNEPKQLEAAGIPFKLYDPSDDGIPGSFGIIYTNSTFLTEFPTAAEDFMRATMKGLADAIADPKAAAAVAVKAIEANNNPLFLSPEGEAARWEVESGLVKDGIAPGKPAGLPLVDELTAEVTEYAAIGLFDGVAPDISSMADPSVLTKIYATDGTVIWPG